MTNDRTVKVPKAGMLVRWVREPSAQAVIARNLKRTYGDGPFLIVGEPKPGGRGRWSVMLRNIQTGKVVLRAGIVQGIQRNKAPKVEDVLEISWEYFEEVPV